MTGIARPARAKLNLTLRVVGRRADGYHLLDSLVAFTELGDTIVASASEDLSLEIGGPFGAALTGDGAENLVLRAARRLAETAGIVPRARLHLTKRLPVASGIGGGSSDAAATLAALSALWQVDLPTPTLQAVALGLGADVPVCLAAGPSRLRGIGEIVTALPDLPPIAVVLVNPGVAVPTPAVFAARFGPFAEPPPDGILDPPPANPRALAAVLAAQPNDLTAAAISVAPVIAQVLDALSATRQCLLARMSGSGATCFALYPDDPAAIAAAADLAAAKPAWWVAATRLSGASGHAAD